MVTDVFLSHNSQDKPAVRLLNKDLQAAGLSTWLDESNLPVGQPWIDEIEAALKSTRSIIVAIGKHALGPWETPEMRAALIEMVRRKVPVIPLLLPDAPESVELPLFLQTLTWVDCRDGINSDAIERIKSSVLGTPVRVLDQPKIKKVSSRSIGMQAFTEFCSNFQSSIGTAAKVGFLIPVLPLVLGLEPPWDGANKLQEKLSVGTLTLVTQIMAVTSVYVLLNRRSPAELRRYFKWSLVVSIVAFVAYTISFLLLTELQPGTSTRLIAGFMTTHEFKQVLEVNNRDISQTKLDFGFDPMRIYQPWTVWASLIAVLLSWLAFFGAFSFYLGSFVQSATQPGPMMDERALAVLNLSLPERQLLQSRGLETVGDLCALTPRQLREMLTDTATSFEAVSSALEQYGIELRPSS